MVRKFKKLPTKPIQKLSESYKHSLSHSKYFNQYMRSIFTESKTTGDHANYCVNFQVNNIWRYSKKCGNGYSILFFGRLNPESLHWATVYPTPFLRYGLPKLPRRGSNLRSSASQSAWIIGVHHHTCLKKCGPEIFSV